MKPSFEQLNSDESSGQEKLHPSLESQANFEGNESILLFERLATNEIFSQITEVYYKQEMERWKHYQNKQEWKRYEPKMWTGEESFTLLKNSDTGEVIDQEELQRMRNESSPSREEIAEWLEKKINEIRNTTEIDYSHEEPEADVMNLN